MNQMHTPTTTSTVGMFTTGDITPETVISDLFTGTVSSLPQWDSSSYVSTTAPTSSVTTCKEELRQSEGGSEGAYDTMHGSSNEESGGSLPLTPPTSDSGPRSSASRHSSEHLSNTDDLDQPLRKKRHPIPEEKKDAKYWERRRKNNVAAKRSREMRRKKTDDELKTAREAIQENQKLKQEVEVLKAEINSLRRLLKDANMTLSLWIRARQTSEPPAQLPPMLRGGNVSFVNFPVSTTV